MSTPSDANWFQIATGIAVSALAAAFGWVQIQISALRRDDERVEDRAVKAVSDLRTDFTARQEAHERTQDRQHLDNQAELAANRAATQASATAVAADMRRIFDKLDGITVRLGEIADRGEVREMIASMIPPK